LDVLKMNVSKFEKFLERHSGIIFSLLAILLAFILSASGSLNNFEEYLCAVVYQLGYNPPEADSFKKNRLKDIVIIKKDEKTSALIGKNPGRSEYASIFRFLNQHRKETLKIAGVEPIKSCKLAEFKLGLLYSKIPGMISLNSLDIFIRGFPFASKPADLTRLSVGEQSIASDSGRLQTSSQSIKPNSAITPSDSKTSGIVMPPRDWIFANPPENFKIHGLASDSLVFVNCYENGAKIWDDLFDISPEFVASAAFFLMNYPEKLSPEKIPSEILKKFKSFAEQLFSSYLVFNLRVFPKPDVVFQFYFSLVSDRSISYEIPPAKIIGMDFLLQGNKTAEEDEALSQAIASSQVPIVLGAQLETEMKTFYGRVGVEAAKSTVEVLPASQFLKGKTKMAFINVAPDNQGYISKIPLFVYIVEKDVLKPSFCLQIAVDALSRNASEPGIDYQKEMEAELGRIKEAIKNKNFKGGFRLGNRFIPVDDKGNMYIYFLGSTKPRKVTESAATSLLPSLSFYECFDEAHLASIAAKFMERPPELAAEKVYARSLGAGEFSNYGGKICLLGPFERSDFDFFPTPMSVGSLFQIQSELLMGVEIHANAIANILFEEFLKPPIPLNSLILMAFLTLLLGFLLEKMTPFLGLLTTILFIGGIFGFGYYSYNFQKQIFYFGSFLISFPLTWALTTFMNYVRHRQRASATKELFGRFVSADVVQHMIEHPEEVRPGGQKVEMTIFFSDVAGFTTISEMLSPEDLVLLMNEYLGTMTDILFKHGGTLDKYIGDAIMAFWNCPKPQEDHAVRACLYALECVEVIKVLQKGWLARGLPKAYARAGINTAEVVVGFMGAPDRMNYTVLGDGVNLASRLEGANKEYGTLLMASDATFSKAKHRITGRFLDFLAVKGKTEPVKVFELVSEIGREPPGFFEKLKLYEDGIAFHNERKWDKAIEMFEKVLVLCPDDGPSKTYIKRCQEYKENPPPEKWDLSYHLTHK